MAYRSTPSNKNIEKDLRWITDLQGMSQRQDMDKIADNASPLLINVSLAKPGSWSKRKGTKRLGIDRTGSGLSGAISYLKSDGTSRLRAYSNGDIIIYDDSANTWALAISSAFTGSKIQSVNYKDRVYSISNADYLGWENGGPTRTEVGTGANRIYGTSLAVAQNTLFVADGTDRVYYSLYDTNNNVAGDQLWNTDETLPTSKRYFSTVIPVVGLYSYGNLVHAFTKRNCYSFDLTYAVNATGVVKKFDIGLAGVNAITDCNGWLLWMTPDRRLFAYGGTQPINLSWDLEDDENGETILSSIINPSTVTAGSKGNQFYFSLGNITYFGNTIKNAVLVGLFNQNADMVLWSLYSYPYRPKFFTRAEVLGEDSLVFTADKTDNVYQMNKGVNDDETTISASAKTKFFDFGFPYMTKDQDQLYVKFRPQGAVDNFLVVKYATDGNFVYNTITDPVIDPTPTLNFGAIDMYASDSDTRLDKTLRVNLPPGINFRTISIEVGNSQTGQSFAVSGLAFRFAGRPFDKKLEVA